MQIARQSFSRRTVLWSLFATALFPRTAISRTICPLFGAIRWDAQYCDTKGEPCFEEVAALSPRKWHFRAPLHSAVTGTDSITFTPSQATFDNEIAVASDAGLNYWAYLTYGVNAKLNMSHSMMNGLKFHRSSRIANRMKYCLISTVDTLGRAGDFYEAVDAVRLLFRDSNYLRTADGRPVLYLYYLEPLMERYWKGSWERLKEAFDCLRERSSTDGQGNPYVVVLHDAPAVAESVRSGIGGDAISAYGISLGPNRSASYQDFEVFVENYWRDQLRATKANVVPTVMIGWDSRPRKETPPAYDKRDYSRIDKSAHIPTADPSEFAAACQRAARFMAQHSSSCPYQLALIYSWNEYSEGGALAPTLGDPGSNVLHSARDVFTSCER